MDDHTSLTKTGTVPSERVPERDGTVPAFAHTNLTHEFVDRRDEAHPLLTPDDEAVFRFLRSWHRHPALRDAVWYRDVNLGETMELAIMRNVVEALHTAPDEQRP
ncbi:MAG: hypothetical protein GY851_05490 [bacterium]|nr:hypothetical protein [bacterium]